jgi:CheY-like chemotaxis protein
VAAHVVFVVVTNVPVRRRIAGDLSRAGLTVVSMGGGRAAIEWARAARPALVVSDLSVLEDASYPLAHQLRTYPETRQVPIVTVAPDEARPRADAAGCTAFANEAGEAGALVALVASQLSAGPPAPSCLN